MEHILTSEDGRSRVVLQANKEATVYLRDEEGASTDEWVQWRTPASLSPALARSLRVFWNLVESDF